MPGRRGASQVSGSPAKAGLPARLRAVAVGLLVGIGCLSLVSYVAVHWTERQILTTENWVAMVGPLPQNPVVASALSNYAVTQLFEAVNVRQLIANALPPKASFLAPTLTTGLRNLAAQTGQKVVASDQFNQVWVAANRHASQTVIAIGRSSATQPPATQTVKLGKVQFQLNLSDLRSLVVQHLGSTGNGVFAGLAQKASPIQVSLRSGVNQLREYVRLIDYANNVLPYLTVACFLGAIALARRRRHAVLAISFVTFILSLLQLTGLRALRPVILNLVHDASYHPAVNVVYSAILHSFNDMVVAVFITSAVLFVLVLLLTGPGRISRQVKLWIHWDAISHSDVARAWAKLRGLITFYKPQIWGGGAIVVLLIMAFWAKVDWTSLTRAVLGVLIFMAIVQLMTTRRAVRA